MPAPKRADGLVSVPPSRVSVVGGQPRGRVAGDEQNIGLSFLLNVLRRWWLIAGPIGLFLAVGGVAVVWLRFIPQFEAVAWLKIEERAPYLAFENKSEDVGSKAFVQTQIEMIRSPLVLGSVVARPEIARLEDLRSKSDALVWLAKEVKTVQVGESELFKVMYAGDNPQSAAAIVNAVTDSYFQLHDRTNAERTARVVEVLEQGKTNELQEISRMRQELSDMTRQMTGHEVYTSKPEADVLQKNELANLQTRLVTAQVEKAVLAARIEAAEREIQEPTVAPGGAARNPSAATRSTGFPGSTVCPPSRNEAALREALIEKTLLERPEVARVSDAIVAKQGRQKEIELRMKEGKSDPVYRQLGREIGEDQQTIEALKKSLRPAVERQTDALLLARRSDKDSAESERRFEELTRMRAELQGQAVLEQRLQAEYEKELRNVKKFSGNSLLLEFKHAELERAEKIFDLISNRTLQLQTERLAPTRVSLLRRAEVPALPVESFPLRGMIVAALAGLCLPFGLALAWERWLGRISDSHDLPASRGLTMLGEIAQKPRRLPPPSQPVSLANIQCRVYQQSVDNLQTMLTLSEDVGDMRIIARLQRGERRRQDQRRRATGGQPFPIDQGPRAGDRRRYALARHAPRLPGRPSTGPGRRARQGMRTLPGHRPQRRRARSLPAGRQVQGQSLGPAGRRRLA